REMLRGGYCPALVPITTPQGPITALAFVSNTAHPSYVGELPLGETAATIATGKGVLGTNRDYLVQLAAQLQALGISDPYVERLSAQIDAAGAG
ncbi:MAG: gamma-glutamylcyclotransferase, partial [Bradyrhizobium sp.]